MFQAKDFYRLLKTIKNTVLAREKTLKILCRLIEMFETSSLFWNRYHKLSNFFKNMPVLTLQIK